MKKLLIAVLMLIMLSSAVSAQCRGRICLLPAPSPDIEALHGWYDAGGGWLKLYTRGQLVGWLEPASGKWQTNGKSHVVDLPAAFALNSSKPAGEDPYPGGVDASRVPQEATYEVSGRKVNQEAANHFLDSTLEDDRTKPFLTAVLSDAERKQFLADLSTHPSLAPWRAKLHVNAYEPGNFHVQQVGLAPGVSFQLPPDAQGQSKVQFRFAAYPGPEALATALRKADPAYQPNKDRDPAKPVPNPPPNAEPTPAIAGMTLTPNHVAGGLLSSIAMLTGAAVVRKRREQLAY